MAQAIKSVLLLDFDSVFRSLGRHGAGVADQFASRAGAWLDGLETGELVGPPNERERRRFQLKRCYADPKVLGKNRGWLTANGVQIVECAQLTGITKSSSATHLILDALDSMEPEPEEVILLVADIDLTPLVFRLKARRQRVVLYATEETPQSYRALADAVVEEASLLRQTQRLPEPAPERGAIPRPPRMAAPEPKRVTQAASSRRPEPLPSASAPARRPAVDRDALAALVRRIHQTTSVPLFSPKAFADLFRLLVEEISANGYKFQSTSENVANGMNALGRNVTKRQVGFVIKGLALRGHVFGEGDRPEQLAEAFYEQVLFLAENAKLALTEPEKGLVMAWVVGLRREEPAPPPAPAPPPPPPAESRTAAVPPPPPMPRAAARPTAAAARPAPAPAPRRRETEAARPAPVEAPVTPRASRAEPPAEAPPRVVRAEPPTRPARAEPSSRTTTRQQPQRTIDDIIPEAPEPVTAPAPAAPPVAERARPTARASFAQRTTQNSAGASLPERRPRTERPPEPSRGPEFEDSILSAIADAVDVLADDVAEPPADEPEAPVAPPVRPAPRPTAPTRATAAPAVDPLPPPNEADEIGDEIQRILASYSQNR